MDRGRESQGSTTACSNMSERDGKDQGEGSPKQSCSYWFARSSWLATVARTSWLAIVARTSILCGTWLMLYCVSLALSVSRLDFVIWFCHWFRYFFFFAPYVLVCCRWIRFFRLYMILMVVLLLLLILFPDKLFTLWPRAGFLRSAYVRIQSIKNQPYDQALG